MKWLKWGITSLLVAACLLALGFVMGAHGVLAGCGGAF